MADEKATPEPVPVNLGGTKDEQKARFRHKAFLWLIGLSLVVALLGVVSIKKQPAATVTRQSTEMPTNRVADPNAVDQFAKANKIQGDRNTPCTAQLMGYVRETGPGEQPEACAPTPDGRWAWQPRDKVLENHQLPVASAPPTPTNSPYGQNPYGANPNPYGNQYPDGYQTGTVPSRAPMGEIDGQNTPTRERGEDTNVVVSFRSAPENDRNGAGEERPESAAPPATKSEAESGKKEAIDPNAFDSATGKKYRLFEGSLIPCTLINRINGAFAGPLNCLVSEDVLSRDHLHILIPQGSVVLGDVSQVNNAAQQRLFAAFHRLIMPDGYAVSLDKFKDLNQAGETGLRDKVNHHYLQIFGASAAIAAVGGLAQIGNFGTAAYSASSQYRAGVTQSMAESSMQVLNKFLAILPTFVIREGARNKVYLSQDLLLPDVKNHTMPEDM